MKNWYIKEFSALTKVSVRTLHHYDDIGLLKPSARLSNGYRVYSQDDLLRLEQIVALKFFGFDLKKIKTLLRKDGNQLDYLNAQQKCLDEQVGRLIQASQSLSSIIKQVGSGKQVEWSKIIHLIEAYHMKEDLKNTWVGKVFTDDQIAQFAQLQKRYTEKEMEDYGKKWDIIFAKVKANLDKDPHSAIGQQLAKEWMDWLNTVYGDYPELKDALSLAYKYNKIPDAPFDQRMWDFIEKAVKYMEKQKKSS